MKRTSRQSHSTYPSPDVPLPKMGKSVRFGSATSPNQVRSMRFGPPSVELSPPPSPSSTTKPSRRALSSTSSYRRASTPNRYGLDDSDSEGENEQGHQQRASTSKSVHNDDKLDKGEGSKDDISEFRLPLSRSASYVLRLVVPSRERVLTVSRVNVAVMLDLYKRGKSNGNNRSFIKALG